MLKQTALLSEKNASRTFISKKECFNIQGTIEKPINGGAGGGRQDSGRLQTHIPPKNPKTKQKNPTPFCR